MGNNLYSNAQVLIFTSPSNVKSYIEKNLIEFNQQVIAIGKSTGSMLEEYNITKYIIPYSPDELGLAEAALSYVGLGTQPPDPSWGRMLAESQTFFALAPWLALFPGFAIVIAVLGFNLLGDGLRDLLDPKTRSER